MKKTTFVLLLLATVAQQPTNLVGQDDCQKCVDSVCPAYHVWLEPGDDILAIWSARGCTWVGNAACPMAIPCPGSADLDVPVDLDALALLAAEGDAGDIVAKITRHPHTLEFVARRHAIAVRGCNGTLLALLPVHKAALTEVANAVAPLSAVSAPSRLGFSTGHARRKGFPDNRIRPR